MSKKAGTAHVLQNYSIGLKLKTLRHSKHLTLARLSAETGYSTALLSKFETDRMVPTLPTLVQISQVYGVGLDHFFSAANHHSLAITRKAHISEPGRGSSETRTHLHLPTAHGSMIATVLELPPGVPSSLNESGRRTELFAYVLNGQLQITIAGSTDVLEAGDCAVLDTRESAVWSAFGNASCRILSIAARTSTE